LSSSQPFRTACPECDLLVQVPALAEGERALCRRCGHLLTSHVRDGFERALACALAAAVLLVVACTFPFLAFKTGGLMNETTLLGAVTELWRNGARLLSVLVASFILLAPLTILGALLALLTQLVRDRPAPWLVLAGRVVYGFSPWSMAEVFLISVLVSLSKIMSLATVILGISFWGYIGFTLCFIGAFACLDRHDVWTAIGRLDP
jgi:paraquat-inducible protein A